MAIPPTALDAPFAQFATAAPWGVPIFDRDSKGGGKY